MKNQLRFLSLMLFVLLLSGMTISCSVLPTDTDGATEPSSSKADADGSDDFTLNVIPQTMNGFAIPGQRCLFLVTIQDEKSENPLPVTLSAEADDAEITLENTSIIQGQVAEITVIPDPGNEGKIITVHVTGTRGETVKDDTIPFEIIEGEDDRKATATELQKPFIEWLSAQHPELGITETTEWTGTMVSPQWLVVSHYLFVSDEWEMHLEWHIMIAPDDWARIDLRRRFTEVSPSSAFEISSREAGDDPISIEVPETIWR